MSDIVVIASWWLILQVFGLAAWPLAFRFLRWLPDRGYLLAKPLGLLIVSYFFWLLVSVHLLPNNVVGIGVAFMFLVILSVWEYRREKPSLLFPWLREHRWLVIEYELLFALAFVGWAIFRAHAPDSVTGEKPMELAFLNAISRSPSFPPYDPWLSGFHIAYYYFGYVIIALLQRASAVSAGVTFSLSNALWFALSAASAFGLLINLVLLTQPAARRAAIFCGILGAIMVVLLGNFATPLEVLYSAGQGPPEFWQALDVLDLNQPPPHYESFPWPLRSDAGWWYRSAWLIHDYPSDSISPALASVIGQPPDPNTTYQQTITEFPQFSFVLGDLHPHTLDLPFVLLSLTLALNLFQAALWRETQSIFRAPAWLLYPLLLGGLGFMNTWDFPIYTVTVIAALGLGRWLSNQFFSFWKELRDRLIDLVLIGAAGVGLYLPFYLSFTSQVAGLWPNIFNGTRFDQFFIMFGPFLVIGTIFMLRLLRRAHLRAATLFKGVIGGTMGLIGLSLIGAVVIGVGFYQASPSIRTAFDAIIVAMQQRGITLSTHLLARAGDPWVPLLLALGVSLIGLVWLAARRSVKWAGVVEEPIKHFSALLYFAGLVLALAVEVVFIVDVFFTRRNTQFKLYYQVWIVWSIASAYAVYYLLSGPARITSRVWRTVTAIVVVATIGLGLIYPALAIPTRLTDSMVAAPTLDALQAVAQSPRYPQADDTYAAAQWLNQSASGAPIVLEATDDGAEYRPARSRLSVWTGLPTVLGWYDHEMQWRGNDVEQRQRLPDITTIYSTTNESLARSLLQKYGVAYIVVGDRERKQYPATGLAKFDRMFPQVFHQGSVTIYRVE